MGNIVFFLRAYNDVDHMTPIIWKFIKKGKTPIVVFHTNLPFKDDYRIRFLQKEGSIKILSMPDEKYIKYEKKDRNVIFRLQKKIYNLKRDKHSLLGRIHRRSFNCIKEIEFLKENNISQCVFEWGTPYNRGEIIEKFFFAAKGLGITTFCLPHGCNMFTHSDVNKSYGNAIVRGRIPDQSARCEYDYYIIQNPFRRDGFIKWGLNPVKTFAWGSARFCPEWQQINLSICPKFEPKKQQDNRLKIVFMQYQIDYNLKVDKIWYLLNSIAEDERIQLVIKESTRAGKDYHSLNFLKKYASSPRVEFVGNEAHSPAIIQWSDCVISYGSSIGVEALLQNKPLINPTYLLLNRTFYEKLGVAFSASSKEEVMMYLNKILQDRSYNVPLHKKKLLYKEIIYGGREEHGVLENYYNKIKATYLLY